MYALPKFHGSSPYSFRENDLNTIKFTPPPPTTTTTTTPEKQYICLASASRARQKWLLEAILTGIENDLNAKTRHLSVNREK